MNAVRNRMSARGWPRLLTAVIALLFGAGTALAPSPATANEPSIIPPGGWCYYEWFDVSSVHGETFVQDGATEFFENNTSQTVTWNVSRSVDFTVTSTYQTSTFFQGGLDLGIVNFGVQNTTSHTLTSTVTVNTTSGFSAPVPPGMTFYAAYGVKRWHVTGTYYQERYDCDTFGNRTVTSGVVNVYRVMDDSQGWKVWEG